jgi:hypothetical protein
MELDVDRGARHESMGRFDERASRRDIDERGIASGTNAHPCNAVFIEERAPL